MGYLTEFPTQSATHTFIIEFSDPCPSTILSIDSIEDKDLLIGLAPQKDYITVTDTIQDGTFCGSKIFTEQESNHPWLNLDAHEGSIDL